MREFYLWQGYRTNEHNESVWVEEKVTPERWQWVAMYSDGTSLEQFDTETGLFHRFAEINQEKLIHFMMRNPANGREYTVIFDPQTMKLIHFYRHTILYAGTPAESRIKVYYFGYEMKINETVTKHLMCIPPDDNVVIGNADFSIDFELVEQQTTQIT